MPAILILSILAWSKMLPGRPVLRCRCKTVYIFTRICTTMRIYTEREMLTLLNNSYTGYSGMLRDHLRNRSGSISLEKNRMIQYPRQESDRILNKLLFSRNRITPYLSLWDRIPISRNREAFLCNSSLLYSRHSSRHIVVDYIAHNYSWTLSGMKNCPN